MTSWACSRSGAKLRRCVGLDFFLLSFFCCNEQNMVFDVFDEIVAVVVNSTCKFFLS